MDVLVVNAQMPLVEFKGIDPTCVYDFYSTALMCSNHPSDIVIDLLLRHSIANPLQKQSIVSEQKISTRVKPRRVGHLGMCVSRIGRQYGWLKAGGVPHFEIPSSGFPSAWYRRTKRLHPSRFMFQLLAAIAMVLNQFRNKQSRNIDFPATYMSVQINASRNYDMVIQLVVGVAAH